MNWLTNFIRPKIQSLVDAKEVPDNLWQKCPSCDGMLFHRDLEDNHNVCYHCGHHLRLIVKKRLALMFDEGKYERMILPDVPLDPLKFKDRKRYTDRLREAQAQTNLKEGITIAKGTIGGQPVVIAAFNFSFMGGSMGAGIGEAFVMAAEEAVKTNAALIAIPASGGARMQEGMLSLVQMPRTIIGVEMVKDAGLPYIVLLTDPTTGGVSASFAMVGDIHLAEPGAMIGFAGRRVIEETVRETLPANFQTAEYLRDHGMVDIVVPRKELHATLARILNLLMNKRAGRAAVKGPQQKSGNTAAQGSVIARPGSSNKAPTSQLADKASRQVRAAQKAIRVLKRKAVKQRAKRKKA